MKGSTDPTPLTVASVFDAGVAYRLAALLEDEQIPVEVISDCALRWDIRVPSNLVAPARVILESSRLSDAELSYLATGTLGGESGADDPQTRGHGPSHRG